jgi:RNA polymerase sigma factor (sigma-70 family)
MEPPEFFRRNSFATTIHNSVLQNVISMKADRPESVSAAIANIPVVEPDCLSRLFAQHYRRVLLAAYRVLGNMADAEDIAQGVFLRLRETEMPIIANAGSYLYRAAINGALDLLRSRNRAVLEPLDAADGIAGTGQGASPEEDASASELARWLRSALGELRPRAAEMFALRYLEEFSNSEIAGLMNTSQAVVAVTLYQTRTKLKKRLKELERGMR